MFLRGFFIIVNTISGELRCSGTVHVNVTWYMLHGTRYMVHGTRYMVHVTWYTLHGTCYMVHVHVTWYTLHGTRYMVHFTWYTLHGTRYNLHGQRLMYHQDKVTLMQCNLLNILSMTNLGDLCDYNREVGVLMRTPPSRGRHEVSSTVTGQ